MNRRETVFALAIAAGLSWGVGTGRANQDANLARGFSPGQLYDYSGIDSVNLYNGVLGLRLPIGPRYPVGDALSYGLTLSYSSNVWDPSYRIFNGQEVPLMEPRRSSDAGLGWTISLGGQLYGPTHPSEAPVSSAGFQFESEDGSIHVFDSPLHVGETQPCAFTRDNTYLRLCAAGNNAYAIEFPDGITRTFTRLPMLPPSQMRPWDIDRFRLTRIEDRFGNWVDVVYSSTGGTWTITDSLGRSHTVSLHLEPVDTEEMWVADFAELAGFAGGISRYDFVHESVEIARSCKYFEGLQSDRFDVPLLRTVLLPADDSGFRMSFQMPDYNTECAGSKDLPGTIKRLDLPTGGRLEWTYANYVFPIPSDEEPDPVREIVDESTGVRTKTVLNKDGECEGGGSCTWTYISNSQGDDNRRTVVTTPEGDDEVSHFRQRRPHIDLPQFTGWDLGLPFTTAETNSGLYLSQEIYDGSIFGGTLLRSVYVAYEHDQLYYGGIFGIWSHLYTRSNRRVKAQRTLYHDDPVNGIPRFTAADYDDFDGLGHYRSVVTFGNLGGSGTHTEYTDYNSDLGVYELEPGTNDPVPGYTPFPPYPHPWVIGTFESVRVEEPGSTFVSEYCFDPLTGRLKRRRMRASASGPGSQDVIVKSTRSGAAPTITYEDFAYGGDVQSVNTGSDLCSIPLPATPAYRTRNTQINGSLARTEPLGPGNGSPILRTLDLAIDLSTGLAKTSTDPAGLAADYEYDKLGRLLWLKPRSGGDAWTQVLHCAASTSDPACPSLNGDPAYVMVRRRPNGDPNGTVLEQTRTVFDPFGRVARDDRKIPGHDWTRTETTYNAMGWVTEVTERGAVGFGLPHSTRYFGHDPFGRPTLIRLPDYTVGNDHDITIDYLGVRSVTREVSIATDLNGVETRYETEELRDHLGRLFRVRERNGAVNAFNNTDYSYDAAGRLAGVTMHGGALQQSRSFNYDGRGFLLSETHPENGTTHYSNYDAGGHAGRKRTGPAFGQFDLAFTYDDAERLTEIKEWGSSGRVLKEFTYGSGTIGADRSKGKIETAVRHNYVLHPQNGNQHDVMVTETYSYGGRGGRPSLRTTALDVGPNPAVKFSQSWGYNQLGQVNLVNYPVCTHSGSTCSPGNDERFRLVTFGHDLGYLTAVPGWASQITYHANGMLDEIHHANGAVYGQGLDEHWMRRPASLWIIHPNNELSLAEGDPDPPGTPHPYAYDGAGNVKRWDDWRYRYDPVSRVLEGAVVDGESQSYTYDPFGNILTITTDLAGNPDPPVVQLGVDPTTNRLSASVYDDAGNLVLRGPFSYSYDSLSMMQTMEGGGTKNTYVYTADDERIWTVDSSDAPALPWNETFALRDLDGKVLRVFTTFDAFDFTNPTEDLDDLAWSQDYIYRDGQLLATARVDGPGETRHHFHLNHLGTPLLITDSDGGTEALHSYFPFGEELFPDQDTERMKFTGHERDLNEAGQMDDLDYMHARYYGPLMGRFLSVDPIGGNGRIPQSWNRYAYVHGNPVNHTDPIGMFAAPFSLLYLARARFTFSAEITVVGDDYQLSPFPGAYGGGFGHKAQYEILTLPSRLGEAFATFLSDLDRALYGPRGMECMVLGDEVVCGEWMIAMMPISPGGVGRIDPNKLNHIFGKAAHNLDDVVVAAGSREAAYVAMQRGAQAAADAGKISGVFELTVNIAGHPVTVRGRVVDGVARVGTAFR